MVSLFPGMPDAVRGQEAPDQVCGMALRRLCAGGRTRLVAVRGHAEDWVGVGIPCAASSCW